MFVITFRYKRGRYKQLLLYFRCLVSLLLFTAWYYESQKNVFLVTGLLESREIRGTLVVTPLTVGVDSFTILSSADHRPHLLNYRVT